MIVKEMLEKLELSRKGFSMYYNIPESTIEAWETGKETPPPEVIEMLEKAVKQHIPRTKEEIMSLPLSDWELKSMCENLIREGYGERSVLLSNDTAESGFHGMYYGFGPVDKSNNYITLN